MPAEPASLYRGSLKHKARPAKGAKGTLCPEWTHATPDAGLGTDMSAHPWSETIAHAIFGSAEVADGGRRRYATQRGIAFEAKPTADGTWHGFPVPWAAVPAELVRKWLADESVTSAQIKRHFDRASDDIRWAIDLEGN